MSAMLKAAQAKIEAIHKAALKIIDMPRVSRDAKAKLKQIAEEAMALAQLLNEPSSNKRAYLATVREFLKRVAQFFIRRDDGAHE